MPEYPETPTISGRRAPCPKPTGMSTGGNHRSQFADRGDGGRRASTDQARQERFQFARRSSRIVRPRVHPMRSAITVAGIVLHSLTSAWMAGSNGSTPDPTGGSALPTTVRTWRRDLRPGDLRRVGVVLPAGRHVLGVRAGSVPGRVLATFMVYDVFRAIAK